MNDDNLTGQEQNPSTGAATYGAVDLSSMGAGAPAPAATPPASAPPAAMPSAAGTPATQSYIDAPLIGVITPEQLDEQVALSRTVPVILLLVSGNSLTSNDVVRVMEQELKHQGGAFVARVLDVDTAPQITQALQVTSLPTAIALVAGQPVPLFEGVPTGEQIRSLLGELLAASAQVGVSGRVRVVPEEDMDTIPPEHLPALEAQENGQWDTAIALWKKVLANNPNDAEAKLSLTRAQFEARQFAREQQGAETKDDLLAKADSLFAEGEETQAYELLLKEIEEQKEADLREPLRQRLVEFFALATNPDQVRQARMRLANILLS